MQADWLECEVEAFLGRLAGDPSCEPTALLEGLLAGYATSGHHNKLSSQSVSRLYALAGLALAKQGAAGAPELMKIAMALSPYDTEYPIHYDAMLDRARAGTARPMILIVSCEKYAARGLRQADRLSELGGVGARIVVGRDAHFPTIRECFGWRQTTATRPCRQR